MTHFQPVTQPGWRVVSMWHEADDGTTETQTYPLAGWLTHDGETRPAIWSNLDNTLADAGDVGTNEVWWVLGPDEDEDPAAILSALKHKLMRQKR